jgi:hypothetical protein
MPAKSEKQRRLFAMALYAPSRLYKKNRGLLKLSKEQLHEFTLKNAGSGNSKSRD